MSTTSTNAAQSATANGTGGLANVVGSNGDVSQMFTTLLIAQIKNQDPTQPTDPSQYVTQLAQLSQLQSLQTLATQGTTTTAMLQGLQALTLGADVGMQVSAETDSVVLGSSPVKGQVTLANTNSTVDVVLKSATGAVQKLSLGAHSAGDLPFTLNPATLGLPAGKYSISFATSSGETPPAQIVGTINSVHVSSSQGVMVDVSNVGEMASTGITSFKGRPPGN